MRGELFSVGKTEREEELNRILFLLHNKELRAEHQVRTCRINI